jgi:CAAX protease family protein
VREIIDTSAGKPNYIVERHGSPPVSARPSSLKLAVATAIFVALLYGFWTQAQSAGIVATLGGHIGSAFACFALMLAVLWFAGFGAAEWIARWLNPESADDPTQVERGPEWGTRPGWETRVVLPALLGVPYAVFAIPRGEFHLVYFAGLALLPVALAAALEFSQLEQKFSWVDGAVLMIIAVVLEARVFAGAWPYSGLGSLPKLYLADVAIYLYLVVRRLKGIGFSFVPQGIDFAIGLREWLFFLPLALGLGFATHFLGFFPRHPSVGHVLGALLVTFLLTAIPEELFFRGILQNLLEPRVGRIWSLVIAACLFGLSHFHKMGMSAALGGHPTLFNWRYVIIAAIAGIFYGRAWRARRHLFASSLTHTLVDVVWGLWFR